MNLAAAKKFLALLEETCPDVDIRIHVPYEDVKEIVEKIPLRIVQRSVWNSAEVVVHEFD